MVYFPKLYLHLLTIRSQVYFVCFYIITRVKEINQRLTLPHQKLFPTHTDQLNNLLSSDQPIQDSPLLPNREGAFYWG